MATDAGKKLTMMRFDSSSLPGAGVLVMAALVLGGCADGNSRAEATDLASPSFVNRLINQDSTPLGTMRVRKVGRLSMSEGTYRCLKEARLESGLPVRPFGAAAHADSLFHQLSKTLSDLGMSPYIGSLPRILSSRTLDQCKHLQDKIVVQLVKSPNSKSKPYRLVLAAWSKDAAWVATAERDGKRPDSQVLEAPRGTAHVLCCEPEYSFLLDTREMAELLAKDMVGETR